MLNDFKGADKVYIACGYTDLRKGIDGLASIVAQSTDAFDVVDPLLTLRGICEINRRMQRQ